MSEYATEAALLAWLQNTFGGGKEYAVLSHVRNGTGFSRATNRTADALIYSLWPSRGLELWGVEVKVSRHDWKRELADVEKSVGIQQFCDRWWILTPDATLIREGELPPTWGWMHPTPKGRKVMREAPKLEAKPLDRPMLAAIFRNVGESMIPRASIAGAIEQAAKAAEVNGRDHAQREFKRLRETVDAFEKASGVKIGDYDFQAEPIGKAVELVMRCGIDYVGREARRLMQTAEGIVNLCRKNLEAIEAAGKVDEHATTGLVKERGRGIAGRIRGGRQRSG